MGFAPEGHCGLQQIHTLDRDLDLPASAISPVGQNSHEPSSLEWLEGRRQGRPVHGEKRSQFADRGGLRPIERHQQRVLTIVKPEGAKRMVEKARQGTSGALGVQAKAGLGDMGDDGGIKRLSSGLGHDKLIST
jgi:hypothetical protein